MKWFEQLKKNQVFRFIASVKMAVPLMVGLAIIVAVGTVIESRYNAQLAGLMVYRSGWFEALLLLLGVNVLASTLIRVPFKKKHIGFVITHMGLLVLLAGAVMTSEWGLDGQLRVVEGQSANQVAIPEMALKVANAQDGVVKSYPFKRSLETLTGAQLGLGRFRKETGLVVEKYLPFASREQGFANRPDLAADAHAGAVVDFTLTSPMFGSARDWLHSKERPEAQMGSTLLKVVVDQAAAPAPKAAKKPAQKHASDQVRTSAASPSREPAASGATVVIRDTQGAELKSVPLDQIRKKAVIVNGVKISVSQVFEQAMVMKNTLVDQGQKGVNPAIEIKLEKGGKVTRDFAFAKFPGFSMSQTGAALGLRVDYVIEGVTDTSGATQMPAGHPAIGGTDAALGQSQQPEQQGGGGSERIEFHIPPGTQENAQIRVDFYNAEKRIASKPVKVGEQIETPWPGTTLMVDGVMPVAVSVDQVRPVEMVPRGPLPDSAIYVRPENAGASEGTWLVEGDFKTVVVGGKSYEVYYGVDSVDLPFSIFLDQFQKIDYPGTETPMSFQSSVRVNGVGNPITIRMNEPLKINGYTLYQSSYEMGTGETASIFSVNKDPGRPVKYLGSLILCLGIVIFSIMKSEWYRQRQKESRATT